MDIHELIKLFDRTGFLNQSKMKRLDMEAVKQTLDVLYNTPKDRYGCSPIENVFQPYTVERDGILRAHISRVHFYNSVWLCQHHAAMRGYGLKVLAKLIRHSVLNDFKNVRWLCSFYRPENPFPEATFGEVYRQVNNEELCSSVPCGYGYYKATDYRSTVRFQKVYNDREDKEKWPVLKSNEKYQLFKDEKPIGFLYNMVSAPGISFSSYTNSTIFNLTSPVKAVDIQRFFRPDAPVIWSPMNYLDLVPEKIYNYWEIKITRENFKWFRALDGA